METQDRRLLMRVQRRRPRGALASRSSMPLFTSSRHVRLSFAAMGPPASCDTHGSAHRRAQVSLRFTRELC